MKWNLLYFDDQQSNIECFKELLSDKFNVIGCQNATKYGEALRDNYPHAILIDVHMPLLDGHSLYKELTQHPLYNGCPIIFISGDQSDENKILSYSKGGVDFLPRDIKTEEIGIRIANKIRFFLQMTTDLSVGNLTLDMKTLKASINETNIDLTILELRLLGHLFRAWPQSLTRSELIQKIWGNETVKPGTINTHLTNLKPKLGSWDHYLMVRDENVKIVKKDDF